LGAAPAHRGVDLGPAAFGGAGQEKTCSTDRQVRTCPPQCGHEVTQGDRQIGVLLRKSARSPVKLGKTKDGIAHGSLRIGVSSRP
jgi:hypothetical protein